MKSLYDLLGVRADDDAPAIKKAFRRAVKAHHPDLHPNDPDTVLGFREIVTAYAVLRDENQRAAYDQFLELERRQIKQRLAAESQRLECARRQVRWKRTRTAAKVVIVSSLLCLYGLLLPILTNAVVTSFRGKPPVGTRHAAGAPPTVEAMRKDEVAASVPRAGGSENTAPAEAGTEGEMAAVIVMARGDAAGAGMSGGGGAGSVNRPGSVADAADQGEPEKGMDEGDVNTGGAVADRGEPAAASLPDAVVHDAGFYRWLGLYSYQLGDFPSAIVNLDEAIRLDPDDAEARNVRGSAFDEIGAFDRALADYDEAIRIDPNNPAFYHDRAVLWHRKGDLDKALIDFDRAIRFSFSDPGLYCGRGLVWYKKGSHARATADFDHAIKLDPNFAAACINRGLILHRNSEFAVAINDLERTIYVNPSVFDVSQKLK